jgi:flavin-dependent dehydrogenase
MCLGPLALDARTCGLPGLVLAGDAAGFIDPMTGDGLRFAIRGGMLAAEALLRAFDEPSLPAHVWLAAQRRREFAWKQRFNRIIRQASGSSAGVTVGEFGARLAPSVLRRLVRVAGDVAHAAAAGGSS